jgi:PAS domain S-box-containing protein
MGRFWKIFFENKWFNHFFYRNKKSSLLTVLVIPFVVLIVGVVGMNGYVSYRNGRDAVNDLANQLMTEIGKRIDQSLSYYMQDIEKITGTNASLVQSGLLDPGNYVSLKKHFSEQLHNYELAGTVALGTEKRDFIALERDNTSFILREYDKITKLYTSYRLNNKLQKTERTGVIENYDPLNDPPHDPWYAKTKARKGSSWLLVVTMAKGPDDPELMLVNFLPIYDKQKYMLGVAASSIYLSQFGKFLKSMKIGQNGQAFVIDTQGNLIATSTGETPFHRKGGGTYEETVLTEKKRIAAVDSKNNITAASMKAIINEYKFLDGITQPRQFHYNLAGARYLMQIVPVKKANLNLLTIIIVPEIDFMGHINKNMRHDLILSILALLVTIVLGIFSARWITAPILRLNSAAKKMSEGEWDKPVAVERSDEIGELANTFNIMTEKLRSSFNLLQQEIIERKQMEKTIRASEERFRSLLQGFPAIAIQGYRLDGTTTYWNQACEKLYGYTAEEAIGRNLLDLIIPAEVQEEVKESMEQMARTGLPIPSTELYLKRKDGRPVSVFSNHALVQLPGDQLELFCLDIDLTERKEAEEQLLFSNFSIEHSSVTTIWFDRHARVVRVNEAACRSLGYSREELLSMTVSDFDPDFQSSGKWENSWNHMKKHRSYGFIESRHQRKDGVIFPVAIANSFFDYTGEEYIVSFVSDITYRKQVEDEIIKEREKLKTLSDNAPFGMALINKEGSFTYINRRFSDIFGFDILDIPNGRTWCRKVYPDAAYRHTAISAWLEDLKDALPGEQKPRAFTVTCRNGTQKVVQFIFSVLISGDYMMTCEDITAMKQLETRLRQAQKMEAIGTLAGGIAHDFNNILTALMGYAGLMKMKLDLSSPLQSYVDQVLAASQKAADLTKGLLTFSRQQAITLIPLDINNTIKGTEKLLRRLLTEDIELQTSFAPEEIIIMGDKSQIDQIIFNLTANARDAMPRGGKLVIETDIVIMDKEFIAIHDFGKPGKYILIRISDTGMGIDESTKEKIFDPFFTTKEVGKGTGLGLATVYGIVTQHNGYIVLDSKPNQGAIFSIYLPAIEMKTDGKEEDILTPAKTGKETILIAEDNPEVMIFMKEALQQYGYRVIESPDGDDAVEKFKKHPDVDLAILDSVMPKKNGREVYEYIRRINPDFRVLFTSGYTKDIFLEKGIEDREFNFIAKPLSINKLLHKIREILDR